MSERRRRRRRHEPTHGSHERWLVSYADFITLLFAFFTTMYAISTVDARKLSDMVDSMQVAFDSGQPSRQPPGGGGAPSREPVTDGARPKSGRESALAQRLRERLNSSAVDIEIDARGIVVSIREAGSFATASADLSGVAKGVLRELAATLADEPTAKVRVEGHTDDVPIQTGRFSSNWELSTARATSVVTFLVHEIGMAPPRLSAAGYGEFHPRVANASAEDRARNRRVDIVILNETAAAEEPPLRAGPPPTRGSGTARSLGAS